jgi:hypothetical protein
VDESHERLRQLDRDVASEQTLEVQCLQKPFLVPCSIVNKRIEDTAAKCGIEPS